MMDRHPALVVGESRLSTTRAVSGDLRGFGTISVRTRRGDDTPEDIAKLLALGTRDSAQEQAARRGNHGVTLERRVQDDTLAWHELIAVVDHRRQVDSRIGCEGGEGISMGGLVPIIIADELAIYRPVVAAA